jgi:hypothetical protein
MMDEFLRSQFLTNLLLAGVIYVVYKLVRSLERMWSTVCEWKEMVSEIRIADMVEDGVTMALKMATVEEPTETDYSALDVETLDKLFGYKAAEEKGVLSQIAYFLSTARSRS